MFSNMQRLYRRIRHGEPIVVVSGLPRSGTSMAMKMLEAGGLPLATDGIRQADEDNPKGYYEFERVKQIKHDQAWLPDAQGKVVKMISARVNRAGLAVSRSSRMTKYLPRMKRRCRRTFFR